MPGFDSFFWEKSLVNIPYIVSGIWSLEVANVIARAEIKFGLTEARSADFLHALQQMQIQTDAITHQLAFGDIVHLARRYNLSAYDAAYLELALRTGLPLATLDDALRKAGKKAGVQLFAPAA